jgi:hypothetical protein
MWSWVLAISGILGMYFVGQKRWQAFLWMVAVECLWVIYSVQTKQYGFILGSLIYMTVYIRNANKWRTDDCRRI